MKKEEHIKIAVVGVGDWGKNLVRNLGELQVLYSLCDLQETLSSLADQYKVKVQTFDQILADTEVDVVVISTPAHTHYPMVKAALKAGKHTFVEKPATLSLQDAYDLADVAANTGRILMVGHLLQYHDAFVQLKQMVHNGKLGRIKYIYSNRLNFGKFHYNTGAAWDLLPHDISMVLALTKCPPSFVRPTLGSYFEKGRVDFAHLAMDFANGSKGHIFASWANPYKEQKLVVIGDKGMAVFDDLQPWDRKLAFYDNQIVSQDSAIAKEGLTYITLTPKEPLRAECQHFINCISSGVTPITDIFESIRVIEVLDKACPVDLIQEKRCEV